MGGRLTTTYTPEIHTLSRVLYLVASVFGRDDNMVDLRRGINPYPPTSTTYGDECARILRIIRINKELSLSATRSSNSSVSPTARTRFVFLTTPTFSTLFSAAAGDGILTYSQSLYQYISTQLNTQSIFNIPINQWNGELGPPSHTLDTNNNNNNNSLYNRILFDDPFVIQNSSSMIGGGGYNTSMIPTYPLPNQTTSSYQRNIYRIATYATHLRQYSGSVLHWLFYFWRNVAINTLSFTTNTLIKPFLTVLMNFYQTFPLSLRSFLYRNLYSLFVNPENRTIFTKFVLDILLIRFLRYGRTVNIVEYCLGLVPFRVQNISSTVLRGGETDTDEQIWSKWTHHAATLLSLKVMLQMVAISLRFLYNQYQRYYPSSSQLTSTTTVPPTVTASNGTEESKQSSHEEYIGRTICSKGDPRIPHVPVEVYKHILGQTTTASASSQTCSICFDERKFPTVTPCGHIFCWSCVVRFCITNPSCPICRAACDPQKLLCLYNYS